MPKFWSQESICQPGFQSDADQRGKRGFFLINHYRSIPPSQVTNVTGFAEIVLCGFGPIEDVQKLSFGGDFSRINGHETDQRMEPPEVISIRSSDQIR